MVDKKFSKSVGDCKNRGFGIRLSGSVNDSKNCRMNIKFVDKVGNSTNQREIKVTKGISKNIYKNID